MNGALLFLLGRGLRNRLRRRLARLGQARSLVPLLAGLGYLVVVVGTTSRGGEHDPEPLEGTLVALVGAWALAAWFLAGPRPRLGFQTAETQWLFQAPLTRAALLRYWVLKQEPGLVVSALVFGLLFGRQSGSWVRGTLGFLLLLNAVTLYQGAVQLTVAGLVQHGRSGWRRFLVPLLLLGIAAGAAWFTPTGGGSESWVRRPPLRHVLWPCRLLARPAAAPDWTTFLAALPGALLVLGGLYVWLLRTHAAFEEAALQAARRRRGRPARGRARLRLPLRPAGPAWRAVAWHAATAALRSVAPGAIVLLAALVGVAVATKSVPAGSRGQILLIAAGVLSLLGPSLSRTDCRYFLPRLGEVRRWPVSGRTVVAGVITGAALPVAAVQTLLVVGALGLGVGQGGDPAHLSLAPHFLAAGALLVLPALTWLVFLADNAAYLCFPAWAIQLGEGQGAGVEGLGTSLVLFLLRSLLLGFSLGLLVLAGALVLAGLQPFLGRAALAPAAGAVLATGVALAWAALGVLGRRLETLDPLREGVAL